MQKINLTKTLGAVFWSDRNFFVAVNLVLVLTPFLIARLILEVIGQLLYTTFLIVVSETDVKFWLERNSRENPVLAGPHGPNPKRILNQIKRRKEKCQSIIARMRILPQ